MSECRCGETKELLDVEFSIKDNHNCWFTQSGVLCKECFKEQKETGSWQPALKIGMEFADCSLCKKKKEECICKEIIKNHLK